MPELPEAETIARGLAGCLVGRTIAKVRCRVPKLRNPLSPRRLTQRCRGQRVTAVGRRGKGVIVSLENGSAILIQLGMTGACRVCSSEAPLAKHEHVIFTLSGKKDWRFEDPRRFGMVEAYPLDDRSRWPEFLLKLGPEPFAGAYCGDYLFRCSRKRTCSIKELLLNQSIVAGIGNIYDCEILFRAGVRPTRAAGRIRRREAERIVAETRAVLADAIAAGGTTISDYRDV
ncbi:MAG: bifunctional DNA-formamidopyrimidine glycosylase/DNA-(apurinic or apyrimidinic site) lyase, partial [Planctomycetota bacterium]